MGGEYAVGSQSMEADRCHQRDLASAWSKLWSKWLDRKNPTVRINICGRPLTSSDAIIHDSSNDSNITVNTAGYHTLLYIFNSGNKVMY